MHLIKSHASLGGEIQGIDLKKTVKYRTNRIYK